MKSDSLKRIEMLLTMSARLNAAVQNVEQLNAAAREARYDSSSVAALESARAELRALTKEASRLQETK